MTDELQTPIASIQNALALLAGGMLRDRPEIASSLIDIAHHNCEHLVLLINDILDIEGMATGRMRFDMEPARLADLVVAAAEEARPCLLAYDVGLALQPIADEIMVLVDAEHFRQTLISLIAFAAKFSPPGAPIQIGATLQGGIVRIALTQSAPGIADPFRSPLIERVAPAPASPMPADSCGLSLHVGKLLIEHMGGKMGVDPVASGSTFWIELPAELACPQPVRAVAGA